MPAQHLCGTNCFAWTKPADIKRCRLSKSPRNPDCKWILVFDQQWALPRMAAIKDLHQLSIVESSFSRLLTVLQS